MAIPVGTANIQIKPSFAGFSKDASKQLRQAMPGLGKEAGTNLGKAMGDGFSSSSSGVVKEAQDLSKKVASLKADQETASKKAKDANDKEAKSAGDLRVAQLKLTEAKESGSTKASALATAEERAAEALRKHEKAADEARTANSKLEKTTEELTEEQRKLDSATDKANKELQEQETASGKARKGLKKVDDQAGRTRGAMGKFGGYLKGGFAGIIAGFSVAAVVSGLGDIVSKASEAEQAMGGVEAVFKGSAGGVQANAATAAQRLGMSETDYAKQATLLGGQAKNILGLSEKEAVKWADAQMVRAADMSATIGGTTEEAVGAIMAGYRGEYEQLERYSVQLNATILDEYAKANDMSRAEATEALLGQQTSDYQGMFEKEAGTFQGQTERMKAALDNVLSDLGVGFMEAMVPVIGWVNESVMPALQDFADWFTTHKDTILPIAGIIVGAILLIAGALGVLAVAQLIVAITNPITLIVLAVVAAVAVVAAIVALVIHYWDNIMGFFAFIGQWIKQVWDGFIVWFTQVWGGFINWIKSVWGGFINWIKSVWQTVLTFFVNLWASVTNAFTFAWQSILNFFRDIWENKIKPIFTALGNFIQNNVAPAFQKGIDTIKSVWDSLVDIAKKPVDFVVGTVINDGLIGGINKITGIFGIPEIPKIPWPPKGWATGGYTGPGSKYQEAGVVHADEFVLRKEATNRLRKTIGLEGLNHMNQTGRMPGYSIGGLVRPVNGPLTSRFGEGRGKYPHAGIDYAVPVGTPVNAPADGRVARAGWNILTGRSGKGVLLEHDNGFKSYVGHLSEILVKVGDQVTKGQKYALSGNTGKSTGPHVHYEIHKNGQAIDPLSGKGSQPDGMGGGGAGPLQFLYDIKNGIVGQISKAFPDGGFMVDLITGAGSKVVDGAIGWAEDMIGGIGDFVGGIFDPNKGSKDQVKSVAGGYGWGQGEQWAALNEIIERESSWKLNAANPNSSARGLFQKMTSIHGPIEGTAGDQAGWGLNYIKKTYGNPLNALAHHDRNGWYAKGGLVKPYKYDNGGWLNPGVQSVVNQTRKPEPILTAGQWQDIKTVAQMQMEANGDTYNIEVPQLQATGVDVAETIQFYGRRNKRR